MTRFLIMLMGLWLAQSAPAATLYVSTNNAVPDPVNKYPTWATAATNIQDAVFAATNDVVLVTNGLYTCASSLSGTYRAMIIVTNSVTLQSVNGPAFTLIDGGNTGAFTNRCFYISNANAVVSGFTITNGHAEAALPNDRGGGVFIGGFGTVTNCWILGNSTTNAPSAGGGGGVYLRYGGMLQNCTIAGNSATNYGGGGVYCTNGGLVQDCTISNNLLIGAGEKGGGVHLTGGGTVTNCRITQNVITTGGGDGAGVCMDSNKCKLINCLVNNNVNLSSCGGGVYLTGGLVSNCVILSNYTFVNGGGIYATRNSSTDIRVENCTISSNRANDASGGIFWSGGGIVRNCLISRNWAGTNINGGGVYGITWGASSTAMIENCTIVSNYTDSITYSAGGIFFDTWGVGNAVVVNSIIYSNTAVGGYKNWRIINSAKVSFSNCCTTPTNNLPGANNITNYPIFMNVVAGDYHLTNGSPCINRGTNQSWMIGATDLDGRSRLDHWCGIVDMGAYEFLPSGTMVSFH